MDEQIRLMDQNLKCLSAAEEKVLTLKPAHGELPSVCVVWSPSVWFCFAAASLHQLIC